MKIKPPAVERQRAEEDTRRLPHSALSRGVLNVGCS
jgi:hypothetical protein